MEDVTLCRIVRGFQSRHVMPMETLLKFSLYAFGIVVIMIGGAMALFGPHALGGFFNGLIGHFHDGGPMVGLDQPDADSELRFYSIMFIFYGGVVVQTAKDLTRYSSRVPLLLGVFWLAGIARLIGYFTVGAPHIFFQILMWIELVLPIVMYAMWKGAKRF